MKKIKAIIVDDEPDSVQLLKLELENYCPDVEIAGIFTNPLKAIAGIETEEPHIVFLDIEMPLMNGFELLEQTRHIGFSVVFITAYNQYALKAFRFNALDYLVKPVDKEDLVRVVAKAGERIKPTTAQLAMVQQQLSGAPITKIAIPGQNGISFIDLDEIVFAEASNNYARLMLTDGRILTISKTLKDIQDVLEDSHFLRIHRQYIINLNHVKHFNRNEGILTMDNKAELPVGRNQKDRLAERYRWL